MASNNTSPIVTDLSVVCRDYTARINKARQKMVAEGKTIRPAILMAGEDKPIPLTVQMVTDLATELAEAVVNAYMDGVTGAFSEENAEATAHVMPLIADLLAAWRFYDAEYQKTGLPARRAAWGRTEQRIAKRAEYMEGRYSAK